MTRGLRLSLLGAAAIGALGALAGCGGHYLFAEREAWRHDAEVECISSGVVREGPGKVSISPIEGPGICGADFPFKVSSLGSGSPLSFGDDPRPPAAIPNAGADTPPRWPIGQPRPAASVANSSGQPLAIDPASNGADASNEPYDFRKPYGVQPPRASASAPSAAAAGSPYDFSPEPYDRRQVIGAPPPVSRPVSAPPTLGAPARPGWGPPGPVAVNPAATLACPLISVLDRWIDEAVQPAALKWIGAPVIEIKQISAYSCRGMNGDPNATISEHAFGNALDIAAFTFADGRKIDVQHGWHGAPEEQAFLHDVQASACDQFTTVLAPGYNVYHYNHIHVDLMRRRSGHRACQPAPVSGAEIAAKLGIPMSARRDLSVTGSIARAPSKQQPKPLRASSYADRKERNVPEAVPGADGED